MPTLRTCLVAAAMALLALTGCTKPLNAPGSGPASTPVQTKAATGRPDAAATIQAKGSDTLLQASQALAEAYRAVAGNVQVSVTGGGTGTGFQALIEGTADIANASRKIKSQEVEDAKARGIACQEHTVGYDGIVVIVNKASPVKALTVANLSDLYTGAITDWSAVGGKGEVYLLSRDTTSGTYEYFKEQVVQEGDKSSPKDFAASVSMLPSNAAIRDEVARNEAAIGYIGLGYLNDSVRPVAVIGKSGKPILPGVQTVRDGSYPISRPLFMYTRQDPTGSVKAYLGWVLSDAGQKVLADEGFVPLRRMPPDGLKPGT